MRILNDLNFPQAYINAISGYDPDYEPKPDRIGVTALIDSPMIRRLYIENYDKLECLASDFFTGFLGTAMHEKLAKNPPDRYIAERKLTVKIGDMTLVTKIDIENGGIGDYKLMSAWSWVFDKEKHFEEQLNIENYIRVKNGDKPAEVLQIYCFIKDWTEYQTKSKDYPQQRYFTHNLKIWPLEQTEKFIKDRLKLHANKKYVCTDEDKWVRVEGWAVMKQGRKSAIRVLDTPQEANSYIQENHLTNDFKNGIISIVERKSQARRCLNYCSVRSCCPFAKGLQK
jgi:hypothetical protein